MEEEKAQKIITALSNYGGFDDWWGNIELEDQELILEDLAEVIHIDSK